MSIWSKIKNAVKKIWRAIKAAVRVVVRIALVFAIRLTIGLPDLFLGFFAWPPKRLRLLVTVLWDQDTGGGDTLPPIAHVAQDAVDRTKKLYKDKFNVKILPYAKTFVQKLTGDAPIEVLDYECSLKSEFGVTGEYFADHIAGWVGGIPVSLASPITVFVVREVKGTDAGCSMNVLGDYVVIDREGLLDNLALAHEIGHTCGLWHSKSSTNLMYRKSPAGVGVKWFQKNLVRSSRHVLYW